MLVAGAPGFGVNIFQENSPTVGVRDFTAIAVGKFSTFQDFYIMAVPKAIIDENNGFVLS